MFSLYLRHPPLNPCTFNKHLLLVQCYILSETLPISHQGKLEMHCSKLPLIASVTMCTGVRFYEGLALTGSWKAKIRVKLPLEIS